MCNIMNKNDGLEIFEDLMKVLKDRDWHPVGEIAEGLSLSLESVKNILDGLEESGVIKSTDHHGKDSLVKGTEFVESFLDLPTKDGGD